MKQNSGQSRNRFYGWTVLGLLFVMFVSGLGMAFYGYSTIFPAMIRQTGWNRGTASIAHTVALLSMGLGLPLIAFATQRFGTRKTMATGMVLLAAGSLLLGTVVSELWQWIVVWGLVCGLGLGFSGTMPVQTNLMHWFKKRRGTAMGIVATGAAVGGFFAQSIHTWVIQATDNWRAAWLVVAVGAVLALICTRFLVDKPEDIGQHADGIDEEAIDGSKKGENIGGTTFKTEKDWPLKQSLFHPVSIMIMVGMVVHLISLTLLTAHGALYFGDMGFKASQAAAILGMILLGAGAGRIPSGILGDRIEPRWLLAGSYITTIIAYLLLWNSTNYSLLLGAGFIYGLSYGTQTVMYPTISGNYFGVGIYPARAAAIGPFSILFSGSVPVLAGYLYEARGSYDLAFMVITGLLFVALVTSFLLAPPRLKSAAATADGTPALSPAKPEIKAA